MFVRCAGDAPTAWAVPAAASGDDEQTNTVASAPNAPCSPDPGHRRLPGARLERPGVSRLRARGAAGARVLRPATQPRSQLDGAGSAVRPDGPRHPRHVGEAPRLPLCRRPPARSLVLPGIARPAGRGCALRPAPGLQPVLLPRVLQLPPEPGAVLRGARRLPALAASAVSPRHGWPGRAVAAHLVHAPLRLPV